MAANWASTPAPKPGNDRAVHMQKSIASGMTQPASPRRTKVPNMNGSTAGCTHVPGLSKG